jgi:hypothetical protein
LFFRDIFCFINPDYRLIRMTYAPFNPEWRGFSALYLRF